MEEVRNNLCIIPNVTVYKRDEIPERFHYKNATNRLGEITALANEEGLILSEVNILISSIKHYFLLLLLLSRQQLIHPIPI
jgi:hypothetical protein